MSEETNPPPTEESTPEQAQAQALYQLWCLGDGSYAHPTRQVGEPRPPDDAEKLLFLCTVNCPCPHELRPLVTT